MLPLADNLESDEYKYEVHVYTGTKKHSGTTSNIKFVVAGTEGDTGIRKLQDGQRKVSENRTIDTNLICIPQFFFIFCMVTTFSETVNKFQKSNIASQSGYL